MKECLNRSLHRGCMRCSQLAVHIKAHVDSAHHNLFYRGLPCRMDHSVSHSLFLTGGVKHKSNKQLTNKRSWRYGILMRSKDWFNGRKCSYFLTHRLQLADYKRTTARS